MSCYNLQLAVMDLNTGKYELRGKYHPNHSLVIPNSIAVPCGRCLGCRLDYSRQWADRMILELDHSKSAIFVTLTYDNDHVPIAMYDDDDLPCSYTLCKRDLQLFFKRLRGRKEFEDREIRFYASGEYGSNTFRPHYHAIIFGLGLEDFSDRKIRGRNELGQFYYESDRMKEIWQNGFILMSEVTWNTCAYVARYCLKKMWSNADQFAEYNVEPEFSLSSRRPGIAGYFFEDHPDLKDQEVFYGPGLAGPNRFTRPSYLFNKLLLEDPGKYDNIKLERVAAARDSALLKMQQTNLRYVEVMDLEEEKKWKKIRGLGRL